tara:strand:+ start:245940 stop:247031 length:1092 start_codon:yes stop_codon:yes gene_type:complete
MNLFYLICPIGLEDSVMRELRLKGLFSELEDLKTLQGGIEFTCPLELGLSLNTLLKTPTRILLRLKTKKCRDFPKLFKTIGQIPWRDYLVKEEVEWRITTKSSRIINTSKAEETCQRALQKFFQGQPLSKKVLEANKESSKQKVFLRFDKDELTMSLDTSGELLHIRGERRNRGKASLRESYASCLLMLLLSEDKLPIEKLVDPMCGTGSFLHEALEFFKPNTTRDFPYKRWPIVKSDKLISEMTEKVLVKSCYGFDLEPVAKTSENLLIETHDIFTSLPDKNKTLVKGSYLICNPPYGKRVKIQGKKKAYFESLIKQIEKEFKPKLYGMIIPSDVQIPFPIKIPFNNNGIKVNFCIKVIDKS